MIDPSANSDAWDKLIVAGVPSPGVVRLTGHKRAIGWDVKDASGQDGATTTRKGEPAKKFSSTFQLVDDPWLGSDFAEWDAFEAVLLSSVSGAKPMALEVIHPDLQRNGWTSAVVESIGELVLDGRGGGAIQVDWLEYRPPKPKASASPGTTTTSDPRVDAASAALDAAVAEGEGLW